MPKLPDNWLSDYLAVMRDLSGRDIGNPQDEEAIARDKKYLDYLEGDSLRAGRGEIYKPEPDKVTGIYVIHKITTPTPARRQKDWHAPAWDQKELPAAALKSAMRKNTSAEERKRFWDIVKGSGYRPQPQLDRSSHEQLFTGGHRGIEGMNEMQRQHLLAEAMVALPLTSGRNPFFLGKSVPGEMSLGRPGGERSPGGPVAKIKKAIMKGQLTKRERKIKEATGSLPVYGQLGSEDWNRGFTMMKFSNRAATILYEKGIRDGLNYDIYSPKEAEELSDIKAILPATEAVTAAGAMWGGSNALAQMVKNPKTRLVKALKSPGLNIAASLASMSGGGVSAHLLNKRNKIEKSAELRSDVMALADSNNYELDDNQLAQINAAPVYKPSVRTKMAVWLHKAKRVMLNDVAPAALHGIVRGGADVFATHLGSIPLLLDEVPVQGRSFDKKFIGTPNIKLNMLSARFREEAQTTTDPDLKKSLNRQADQLDIERMARGV
jgi:hypothetical protein